MSSARKNCPEPDDFLDGFGVTASLVASFCEGLRKLALLALVGAFVFQSIQDQRLYGVPPQRADSNQASDTRQLFEQALEAQKRGDNTAAVIKYREIVRLHPEMTAARANLGIALVSLGQYDEAITQYQTALAQAPGNADLRFYLALAYYKKSDLLEASRQFKSLLENDPRNMRAIMLLADSSIRLGGHDDEVIAMLTPLEKSDPENIGIEWPLGTALIRTGKTREGLERVEKVAQKKRLAEAYSMAASAHFKLQEFDEARRDLNEAMRLNPRLPGLQTLDGMIRANAGDYEGAVESFRKAIESDPNDLQAHLHLGSIFYTHRKLDDAQREFDRALEVDPGSYYARYELARVEKAQGKLDAALLNLENVVKQIPEWIAPHIELVALYYRLNRPQDGAREKKLVDQLTEDQRQKESKSHIISP